MKTKKYLVSTLLASGLVIGAAAVSPALAQFKSLQPQSSWAVSKVDKAAQAGKSYCTLSRKYDDGVVLSLARNQAEEYSLAIDFQKDAFEKDKPLKIQLEPGPGQLRAYDLMPVSTKAVVIRLGWDDGFFNTLSQSQAMKVRLGDDAYNFGMTDIVKGQGDLDACMKGLQGKDQPASAAASTDVLNAQPVQMASGFEASRADAPMTPAALSAAKDDVRKKEEKVLGDFARGVEAKENVAASKVASSSNINKSGRNAAPSAMVAEAPAPAQVAAKAPAVAVSAPVPRAPDAKAVAAVAPSAAPVPLVAPVVAAKPDPALTSEIARLKNDVTALQVEKAGLQQRLDSAAKASQQAATAQQQAKEKELQSRIAQLETTNGGLLKQVETASRISAQKESSENIAQARTEAQIEADAKRIVDLEKGNAELQQKLADATRAATVATATSAEAAQSAQRIAALNTQVETLQKKLADASSVTPMPQQQNQNQQSMEMVATLNAQVQDLEKKLAAASAASAQQTAQAGGEAAQLKAQQDASAKTIADLQQKLADAQKASAAPKADDQKVAALQSEITQLKARNDQLQESMKVSQTKVAEAAFNAEGKTLKQVADLQVRLEAAQKDNVSLSKQIDDLKNRQDDKRLSLVGGNWDLEQATRRFNEAEREIRRLGLQLEKERTTCNREKAEIEQMLFDPAVTEDKQRQKFVSLEAELNDAKEQLADQTKLVQGQVDAQVKQKTAALEAERNKLQEQVMAMQVGQTRGSSAQVSSGMDVEQLRDQNIMLKNEAERLRLQIADASSNGAVRADNVASMRLEVEDLKRQLAMKDNQTRTYQNQLANAQRENSQIKSRLTSSSSVDVIANEVAAVAPAAGSAMASGVAGRGPSYHSEAAKPSAPVREASVSAKAGSFGKGEIEGLLRKSGMPASGFKAVSSGLSGADNYGWSNGGKLKGFASVKSVSSGQFDAAVNQYIAAQKAQCSGDFASVPSPADKAGRNMATYEVACVSGANSTSSSILFFEESGKFVAMATQTDASEMDLAMDARDKLAGVVRGM